jgi:uncharacterized protein YdaU (DUF1376 family)
MSSNGWIPFYTGDYERDTRDLTMLEHGAYFALLRNLWATGKEIADEKTACRIAGAICKAEREAVKCILNRFFLQNSEGFYSKKVTEIRAKQSEKSTKAKRSAEYRWNANASKTHNLPDPDPDPDIIPTPLAPKGGGSAFEKFAEVYPKKVAMAGAK